jgi:16S rRNA A1518/A1519 N6-dimethyltransferase RsmA/KsgA/DIM1 with predicted DNA glycosylase/AP lyase activity
MMCGGWAALGSAPRVLEIGCGSGQATLPLLELGTGAVPGPR